MLSGSPSCGARLAIVSLPCCSSYDAPSICHPSSHPERTAAASGRERKSIRTLERSYSHTSRKTRSSIIIQLISIASKFGVESRNYRNSNIITGRLTCFRDFLIIGWGLSSSSEKARVRGSKSRPDEAIESATRDKPYCIRDESSESVARKRTMSTLV